MASIAFIGLLLTGFAVWEYRAQRDAGLTPGARRLRRIRLVAGAAIGFGAIGLDLVALGYGGRGELHSTGMVQIGIPSASHGWQETPTPFAVASVAVLTLGLLTALLSTVFLHTRQSETGALDGVATRNNLRGPNAKSGGAGA
jgi:hypothetical protein